MKIGFVNNVKNGRNHPCAEQVRPLIIFLEYNYCLELKCELLKYSLFNNVVFNIVEGKTSILIYDV